MNLQESDLQNIFDYDIEMLKQQQEDEIGYIEQSHFGDLLIEVVNENNERFKLWRNLDCNNYSIEVEYHGKLNRYRWETVLIIKL